MDNQTRSELTRNKAIEAALVILERDGVSGLTFDALARESGVSKGGLLHQFRTKNGVLDALAEYQSQHFERVARDYLAKEGASKTEPTVASRIAIYRESANQPHSVARAVLATLIANPNPELLEKFRAQDAQALKQVEEESPDLDLALIRSLAASGLAFATLLGISSLTRKDRDRLYARLLDEQAWEGVAAKPAKKKRTNTQS
ncbi:TetR/AcrR family transcriptional regulator [Trinickia dinghuensis]|uniref:TetR/AcrR family transcriptional regulator n=1 Tax=Trinickia dinghuensis TaxID=2291023 RepID=A0A3D8K601_9BURK|nr:TetR/AcrR family transcriptional regulator [Trinickia dinghuensis]RDV00307.1 TetR/AcrR family transcriptional regulator [Trinickia dinghuensis]